MRGDLTFKEQSDYKSGSALVCRRTRDRPQPFSYAILLGYENTR